MSNDHPIEERPARLTEAELGARENHGIFPAWVGAARQVEDPPHVSEPPWSWDWAGMDAEEAAATWEELATFVAFLNSRYAWRSEHRIPPCWYRHGACVEELTTLMVSRWASFTGPKASPVTAQIWHHQSLPGFYDRLSFWFGANDLADCRGGRHRPSDAFQLEQLDCWSEDIEIVRTHDLAARRVAKTT